MELIQKKVPPKIDFRADGTHESHPTAWELITNKFLLTARENAKSPKSNFIIIFVMSIWHLSRAYQGAMSWWGAAGGRILDEREAGCLLSKYRWGIGNALYICYHCLTFQTIRASLSVFCLIYCVNVRKIDGLESEVQLF